MRPRMWWTSIVGAWHPLHVQVGFSLIHLALRFAYSRICAARLTLMLRIRLIGFFIP